MQHGGKLVRWAKTARGDASGLWHAFAGSETSACGLVEKVYRGRIDAPPREDSVCGTCARRVGFTRKPPRVASLEAEVQEARERLAAAERALDERRRQLAR
jgi:hypothetical protein